MYTICSMQLKLWDITCLGKEGKNEGTKCPFNGGDETAYSMESALGFKSSELWERVAMGTKEHIWVFCIYMTGKRELLVEPWSGDQQETDTKGVPERSWS